MKRTRLREPCPKYWRRLYTHKRRRASKRMAIAEVMKGNLDALFPLDKMPYIYFW